MFRGATTGTLLSRRASSHTPGPTPNTSDQIPLHYRPHQLPPLRISTERRSRRLERSGQETPALNIHHQQASKTRTIRREQQARERESERTTTACDKMEHPAHRPIAEDEFCCHRRLIGPSLDKSHCHPIITRYHDFIRRIRYNRGYLAINPTSAVVLLALAITISPCLARASAVPLDQYQAGQAQYISSHHLAAQARGLDPSDYVDEAGELEVMLNQQQIPTAQLMSAAGHIVPENFFLPGGTIPALYSRYQQQQQQQQQQSQQQQQQQSQQQQQQQQQASQQAEAAQQVAASQVQARHLSPMKYLRQADLLAAASTTGDQSDGSQLIDFNSYNLVAPQDGRDAGSVPAPMDLAEFLSPAGQMQALYEQQQQQLAEQQLSAELAALQPSAHHHHQHHQHHQQQTLDNSAQSSEMAADVAGYSQSIGPAYQIAGHSSQDYITYGGQQQEKEQAQKPYGLPTKSSSKEPHGMLKPLGNPKTVSSPVIDFVANQMPKNSNFEKLADKLPQHQTPTVFSFASSKDPMEKIKGVNQKKRNVMRQAEQLAKAMIKSVNEKFGTTIGDQTDIPFLLSSLGPLGLAQNILFDPSLLITLLNSAEKTYFGDVLPAPAKMAIRPMLNIFRVPNRKRDKANLLNIISYLASGGQTPSTPATNKNRQALGVEKQSNKNKSKE